MRIYDISQPLVNGMTVWPGDTATSVEWAAQIEKGSSVNLGRLSVSLHAGTHADAPLHYRHDSAAIDEMDLAPFIGRAYVWERLAPSPITRDELEPLAELQIERLLIKTRLQIPNRWTTDFAYPKPETVDALAEQGVKLIGLDTPSFDHPDSKDLPAHQRLAEYKVANLENLDLSEVPGNQFYFLSALPLRVVGMDAAPVRAVLLNY